MTKMQTPTLTNVELVSDGWIKKYLLSYRTASGKDFVYESVSRKGPEEYRAELQGNATQPAHAKAPDAVNIVPRTLDDKLVMVREFRYPLNSWCIAFPAGLIEPGETIEEAAVRELEEETGYVAHIYEDGKPHVKALSQPGYSSAGMSGESVQTIYLHVENEPTKPRRTEDIEFIEVFTVAMDDIPRFLEENTTPIGTRAQLILEAFSNNIKRYGKSKRPE